VVLPDFGHVPMTDDPGLVVSTILSTTAPHRALKADFSWPIRFPGRSLLDCVVLTLVALPFVLVARLTPWTSWRGLGSGTLLERSWGAVSEPAHGVRHQRECTGIPADALASRALVRPGVCCW
jgi:hypothetical protein